MSIELDHLLIPVPDPLAAARLLARLLDVPWAESSGAGPFSPVYVSDGLRIDFDRAEGACPVQHYCFRVDDACFDAILARIREAGIGFRSQPHGPVDHRVNTAHGGRIVYWNEPGGHVWELLTLSDARQQGERAGRRQAPGGD